MSQGIGRLLSGQEVAERLGIPRKTLTAWHGKNYGPPSFRVGRWRKYPEASVEAWLEEQSERCAT